LIDAARWCAFEVKRASLEQARSLAAETTVAGTPVSLLMKRPHFRLDEMPESITAAASTEAWDLVETEFKYEGYVRRQAHQNQQITQRDAQRLPPELDFSQIPSLRPETRQKLTALRPDTLGQAARISGITPADIAILSIWMRQRSLQNEPTAAFLAGP
jgi:tRNA uridine 5-carboxymethylaminomethyl modification enzyme